MKYKLLKFQEDYADEFDVPALAVMTEDEYNIWLKTPSGDLNPNYLKGKEDYELAEEKNKAFWEILKSKGYTLNGSANISTVPKNDTVTQALIQEHYSAPILDLPPKVNSSIYGYLGNYGDGFEEQYSHLYLMEEFVSSGSVEVFDVSKSFYDTFKEADLSSISLCNVFDM